MRRLKLDSQHHEELLVRTVLTLLLAFGCSILSSSIIAQTPTASAVAKTNVQADLIILKGLGGEEPWAEDFKASADKWLEVGRKSEARIEVLESTPDKAEAKPLLDRFLDSIAKLDKGGAGVFWLVMLGHGTFDGQEAKFNLEGPDLTALQLSQVLKPFTRPMVIVQGASASGAFMNELRGANRIVITGTRSGFEQNYARFGRAFASAVGDMASDLDQDGQVSALEAYLSASHKVSDFYKSDGRMLTEHALLDDNGDGKGTPPDWYRGVRAVKKSAEGGALDGLRAHQIHLVPNHRDRALSPEALHRRDALEFEVFRLRDKKAEFKDEEEYFRQLEKLLLEIGSIYSDVVK